MAQTTLIVGASIGGVRTAQALRGASYTGRILLVGDETVLPYDKPPLSKALLAGTATADDVALLTQTDADHLGIDVRLGHRAVGVDLAHSQVEFATGARLGYDHLVIATGARARPSPWGQPDGVHMIRTLDDAQRLRADLERGGRLVVIGGGFIGSETAATARSMGLTVTIVDPEPVLMQRVLGAEIGQRFTHLHQRHGVTTIFGVGVNAVTGARGDLRIHLSDGRTLNADCVVVGIGAVPNHEWLASSGLKIDNGVVCDEYCRAIDTPNVYAVGDVACWQNPRRGRLSRVEHWTNATEQAAAVAHNINHPFDSVRYAPVEFVWSDQYDWKIRVAGQRGTGADRHVEVIGEDAHTGRFAGLYSADGQTLSGMVVVNWPRALIAGRKALDQHTPYPTVKQALEQLASAQRPASAKARL